MAGYVNPPHETKEEFLVREGRLISVNEAVITEKEYPVCLIDNVSYSSAAIGYSTAKLAKLVDVADIRPKVWYMILKSKLTDVSDIEDCT